MRVSCELVRVSCEMVRVSCEMVRVSCEMVRVSCVMVRVCLAVTTAATGWRAAQSMLYLGCPGLATSPGAPLWPCRNLLSCSGHSALDSLLLATSPGHHH